MPKIDEDLKRVVLMSADLEDLPKDVIVDYIQRYPETSFTPNPWENKIREAIEDNDALFVHGYGTRELHPLVDSAIFVARVNGKRVNYYD